VPKYDEPVLSHPQRQRNISPVRTDHEPGVGTFHSSLATNARASNTSAGLCWHRPQLDDFGIVTSALSSNRRTFRGLAAPP